MAEEEEEEKQQKYAYLNRTTELVSYSKNAAYILVKCEPGLEEEVLSSLKKTKGVVEVNQVYSGPYDMVIKIDCDSLKELDSTVWRTRRANGIRLTQTLIVGDFA